MKKYTFLFICFWFLQLTFAQIQIIGSDEFGRIFDLTYDRTTQDKAYAISMGNHILQSTDNGQNWEIFYAIDNGSFGELQNNLKTYQNNSLTYIVQKANNHIDSRTVYVLDIETQAISQKYIAPEPDSNFDGNWIQTYSISESDPNYALISVGYKIGLANFEKVFYTQDGGENWSMVYATVDNQNIFTNQVAIDPENPEKLFLTRGQGDSGTIGGILISENGGQSWTEKLDGIILNPIAFHPENSDEIWVGTGIAFGAHPENLYKSIDGGQNWEIVPINWTNYILNTINVIQFNPNNPQSIIILEENEVVVSYDGGANWNIYVYPDAYDQVDKYSYGTAASFNPFNENELLVSANYYPMFSNDQAETLTRIKTPFFAADGSVHIYTDEENELLYYGAQYGTAYKNLTTGEEAAYNVMPLNYATINSGTTLKIDKNKFKRVYNFYGGFMGFNLTVSDDHGENQNMIHMIFSNTLHDLAISPDNHDKIWASYSNIGENPEVFEIDFTDPNNIQSHNINLPNSSGVVMGILFDSTNAQNVTVARGSRIHKTNDGGNSWELSSNGLETLHIDNDMIMKLVQNPINSNQYTIATNKGIFTSIDKGENWTQIHDQFAHNVAHSSVNDGHIVVATHSSDFTGFGLRYTKDGGNNWHEVTSDDLYSIVSANIFTSTDFQFHENSVDVYIATSGLGMVKLNLDLEGMNVNDPTETKSSMTLYPNPTSNKFHINTDLEIEEIKIYNASGQSVLTTQQNPIDITHLPSGVYFMKIWTKDGKQITSKIIKK